MVFKSIPGSITVGVGVGVGGGVCVCVKPLEEKRKLCWYLL